ncbi:MAG TPA: VOC family protein [Kofleriaceae bacterium]|nr:VOC family protein [Kofleriaceae bacterium]
MPRLTYLELPAIDPERSAAFYAAVCGWKIDRRGPGDLRLEDQAAQLIGRWVVDRAAAREPGMVPYFMVDSVEASIAAATAHGGEIVAPPRLEGDTRIARLRDPAGTVIGIWQLAR